MKFREKSIAVEAIQFKDDAQAIIDISDLVGYNIGVDHSVMPPILKLYLPSGILQVDLGCWVVRDLLGFHIITSENFHNLYEPIQEEPTVGECARVLCLYALKLGLRRFKIACPIASELPMDATKHPVKPASQASLWIATHAEAYIEFHHIPDAIVEEFRRTT